MEKLLLMGDEAIAQAALDAGISGIYAYPGTPSTEILEYVQKNKAAQESGVHSTWSTNEKTALENALGMSYAGKRAISCMKHVGLNVAADPFMNSSVSGVNGGFIIVSADDPSMHSSQNEQDSRFFGKFANMPVFEPSNQQEAYDMTYYGFEYSEKFNIPVLMRITTRLAHSRSGVKRQEVIAQKKASFPANLRQFVLLPSIARKQYAQLLEKQKLFEEESEKSIFNSYNDGPDKSLGIIACGIGYNYLLENFEDQKCPHPVLKISQYPAPRKLIKKLMQECEKVLILEEGYPLLEETLTGILGENEKVKGRLDGTVPRTGELNSNIVAKALGFTEQINEYVPEIVMPRPPSFCAGCPHIDSYKAINEVLADHEPGRVMADIGCYTLAALPPFNTVNSCVDMGASITMAKGLSDAGIHPAVAVIGDSTFTHSGITGLLDCVNSNSNVVIFILDNFTTGMTGGQESPGYGKLEDICKGVGVDPDHIRIIKPLIKFHEENVKIINEELAYNGVSVIIPRRECIQTINKRVHEKHKAKVGTV